MMETRARKQSTMELKTVDPRTLKINPDNPRRTGAGEHPDAQMVANIKAVGILQPPVVREKGKHLEIVAGHRRVAAAIAAGFPEVLVLVRGPDDGDDNVRALSENVVRAQLDVVSQWKAIQALVSADWTEEAISTALALPVRTLRKLRLLAQMLPAMLTQMELGDVPGEGYLRVIAAASPDEQAAAWKRCKPKKGQQAAWHEVARVLEKRTLPAKVARFDDELARIYGVTWTDDLFVPAGEDGRTTEQVEQFMAAQGEWLANNLPEGGHLAELDQYGSPRLPREAMRSYGQPRKGESIACYVDPRTGEVEQVGYRLPEPRRGADASTETGEKPAPKPRPDITSKGVDMIGALRTDALHQALRESAIPDEVLMGLLVLGLGAQNVQVRSGAEMRGYGWREGIAGRLTEGGVLTQDLGVLRAAAREMLVEVLSCRTDMSQSGMNARYAGAAIGADALMPNMATTDFLKCLSKQAMERTASANGVAPRNTGKETRAAMVAHCGGGTFVHPAALFPPTAQELQARRHRGSLIVAEQPNGDAKDEDEALDSGDAEGTGAENDVPPNGAMPPPVAAAAGQQPAA
jgi:ParB family chromosome partitioning protein